MTSPVSASRFRLTRLQLDDMWPSPELLATVLFSGFFICLGNSTANAIAFAKLSLAASDPDATKTTSFDKRLVSLIAVSIVTVVCLLHYFSQRTGLLLNRLLAFYKAALLLTVFIAGALSRNKPNSGTQDWGLNQPGYKAFDGLSAIIYVLYSYQGWENANYVSGEIRNSSNEPSKNKLRLGAYLAVFLVTILYILATLGYYLACDYVTITSQNSDLGMAEYFAPQAFGATTGFKICIALSAVGNLVAVVYTNSKVKQSIAIQRIVPFYTFFAADDGQFGTPRGALILHWLSSVILVLATPNSTDGYSFILGLFTYGHLIVGVFLGLGLWRLSSRMALNTTQKWKPNYLKNEFIRRATGLLFVGINIFVLVVSALPHAKNTIPRYWWPATIACVIAASFVYWVELMVLWKKGGHWIGIKIDIKNADTVDSTPHERLIRETRRDGTERRVIWEATGVWQKIGKRFEEAWDFFYKYCMK